MEHTITTKRAKFSTTDLTDLREFMADFEKTIGETINYGTTVKILDDRGEWVDTAQFVKFTCPKCNEQASDWLFSEMNSFFYCDNCEEFVADTTNNDIENPKIKLHR